MFHLIRREEIVYIVLCHLIYDFLGDFVIFSLLEFDISLELLRVLWYDQAQHDEAYTQEDER